MVYSIHMLPLALICTLCMSMQFNILFSHSGMEFASAQEVKEDIPLPDTDPVIREAANFAVVLSAPYDLTLNRVLGAQTSEATTPPLGKYTYLTLLTSRKETYVLDRIDQVKLVEWNIFTGKVFKETGGSDKSRTLDDELFAPREILKSTDEDVKKFIAFVTNRQNDNVCDLHESFCDDANRVFHGASRTTSKQTLYFPNESGEMIAYPREYTVMTLDLASKVKGVLPISIAFSYLNGNLIYDDFSLVRKTLYSPIDTQTEGAFASGFFVCLFLVIMVSFLCRIPLCRKTCGKLCCPNEPDASHVPIGEVDAMRPRGPFVPVPNGHEGANGAQQHSTQQYDPSGAKTRLHSIDIN